MAVFSNLKGANEELSFINHLTAMGSNICNVISVLQTACYDFLQKPSKSSKSASDLTMRKKPRVLMHDKDYVPRSVCGPNDDISAGRRLGPGMWAFT